MSKLIDPTQGSSDIPEPLGLAQVVAVRALTGIGNGPDGNLVIARYESANGSFLFMLTPEEAKAHAEDLLRRVRAATSGIDLLPGTKL